MKKKPAKPCAVPTCPAMVTRGQPLCAVHAKLSHEAMLEAAQRTMGLVAPLQPVTTRIEYDAAGRAVRFYPDTRR